MGSVVLLQRLEFPSRYPWALWFCYFILTRKFLSRSPWALPGVRGLCGSVANPEKEIPFKESVGSVILLQHLDKEIVFKVSVGSVVLLQQLDKEILFKVSVGSGILLQYLDKRILFKVSVGSVVLLQQLDKEISARCLWALCFCCNILTREFSSR